MRKILVLLLFLSSVVVSQEYSELYVIGDATPKGWNQGHQKMELIVSTDTDEIYAWKGPLNAMNGNNKLLFKFLATKTDWLPSFNATSAEHQTIELYKSYPVEKRISYNQGDIQFSVPEDGIYTVELNTKRFTMKVIPEAAPEDWHLALVGTALKGWGTLPDQSVQMNSKKDANNLVYTWTGKMNEGGDGFKILVKNTSYEPSFRANTANQEITIGSTYELVYGNSSTADYKFIIPKTGYYTVTIDLAKALMTVDYVSLYLVGGATSAGWHMDNVIPMTRDAENPNQFSIIHNLAVNSEGDDPNMFKILGQDDWWYPFSLHPNANGESILAASLSINESFNSSYADNKWALTSEQEGSYFISVDLMGGPSISIIRSEIIEGGSKFYLTPNANWKDASARFAMYYMDDSNNRAWANFVKVDEDVYEAVTPEGTWTEIVFVRMNPGTTENNWDNKWNQTANLRYDGVNNHYTINEGSWSSGTWAFYSIPMRTFTVKVPQGTEKVYIAGTFPDKSWKINAVDNPYELEVTENPRVFTGTFQCGSGIQYQYLNGTNDNEYYEATDNLTIGGSGNPSGRANRSYTEGINDTVKYWIASPKLKLEVTFAEGVTVPSSLHVKGKWNEWGEATELTYADGKFSGTINQKVYSNTTYKYRTNDVITANWEIRKLPNTENTNNPSNDRWAIYPSMSDKIRGFVTDPMVHVGRKPANNLKIEEDLTITLPTGAAVNYLLTTGDFSEDNPTDEYDATNGIEIATSGVYYLKRKISQNDSSYIKQTPINIGPITWKDNGNTTWGTATNWTINSTVVNRTPITKEDVVIPASLSNYPILNTDANIGSLEIASGAKLTINTESKLAVDGNITNNNGASGILIKADPDKATGTLLFNNPVNEPVQATVEMYARGSWDATSGQIKNVKWQYFGIPFTHIDNIENAFYGAIIRKHNEAGTTSSSILPVATGKWIQLVNGSDLAPIQGYEIAQLAPKTYVLSGTLYKGDFNYTASYTPGVAQAGQHVISNPYMAAIPIDAINFGADNRMDETVYVYNTGSLQQFNANESKTGVNPGQYIASPFNVAGYGSIPNEIAPMQGFLVRTAQGVTQSGGFSITYNQLVKNTAKQRAPKSPKSWLRLTLSAENTGDVMWLFSEPETSRDFDNGWDGRKMGGDAGTPMLFSHNETGNYQINAMDDIDETDIAFRAGNADTEYTITFNHGDGLMGKYVDMYCEDLVTGAIINISEDNTEYSFQSTNTNIHSRFKIHATKVISDVNKEEIMPVYVYADGRNLVINNASKEPSRIDLYDTLGRLFASYQVEGGEMQTYQPNVQQGTYIVKVTNSIVGTYKVVLR